MKYNIKYTIYYTMYYVLWLCGRRENKDMMEWVAYCLLLNGSGIWREWIEDRSELIGL